MRALMSCLLAAVAFVTALIMSPGFVLAQEARPAAITIHHVDVSQAPRILVYVSVLDATGATVSGLGKDTFRLAEDDADMAIVQASGATSPLALVVLVDVTSSMNQGVPKGIEAAKSAGTKLLTGLKNDDQIALLTFTEHVGEIQPFIEGRLKNQAINALNQLSTKDEWTALYDAVIEATKRFTQGGNFRRAVLVLSDGKDSREDGRKEGSKLDLSGAAALVKEQGIPIFTIGFGPNPDVNAMRVLAESSGGRFYRAESALALEQAFETVHSLLRQEYVLEYKSPGFEGDHALTAQAKGANWNLQAKKTFKMPPPLAEFTIAHESRGDREVFEPRFSPAALKSTSKVEYYLNRADKPTFVAEVPPYRYELDTGDLSAGSHTLVMRAYNTAGRSFSAEATVNVPERAFSWNTVIAIGVVAACGIGVVMFLRARRQRAHAFGAASDTLVEPIPVLSGGTPTHDISTETPTVDIARQTIGELRVTRGEDEGLVIPVRDGDRIGRGRECEIIITDSQEEVSREHACFLLEDGTVTLEDLGSRNGTRIDGQLLARGGRRPLPDGAVVGLARRVELIFRTDMSHPPFAGDERGSGRGRDAGADTVLLDDERP